MIGRHSELSHDITRDMMLSWMLVLDSQPLVTVKMLQAGVMIYTLFEAFSNRHGAYYGYSVDPQMFATFPRAGRQVRLTSRMFLCNSGSKPAHVF